MAEHSKWQTVFAKWMEQDKIKKLVVALGVGGMLLIGLSAFWPGEKKEGQQVLQPEMVTASGYERQMEEKLAGLVSAITGEQSPSVMVTLERDSRYVYAVDERQESQSTKSYEENSLLENRQETNRESNYLILKDADGSQHAVQVTEIQPVIKGVVIVSEYADNAAIQEKLVSAVRTALGVPSSRVCVIGTQ